MKKNVLLSLTLAIICFSSFAGHDTPPSKTSRTQTPTRQLSNKSLTDLLKCEEIIQFYGDRIFPWGDISEKFAYKATDRAALENYIENAGNHTHSQWEVSWTLQNLFFVESNGKKGLFIRKGDKSYFVETPGFPKPEGRIMGSLALPGETNSLGVVYETRRDEQTVQPYSLDKSQFPQFNGVLADDTDPGLIASYQKGLDKFFADTRMNKFMFNKIVYLNLSKAKKRALKTPFDQGDVDHDLEAQQYLVKVGNPDLALGDLEACKSALAPNNTNATALVDTLKKIKQTWKANYQIVSQLQNGEKILGDAAKSKLEKLPDDTKLPY